MFCLKCWYKAAQVPIVWKYILRLTVFSCIRPPGYLYQQLHNFPVCESRTWFPLKPAIIVFSGTRKSFFGNIDYFNQSSFLAHENDTTYSVKILFSKQFFILLLSFKVFRVACLLLRYVFNVLVTRTNVLLLHCSIFYYLFTYQFN